MFNKIFFQRAFRILYTNYLCFRASLLIVNHNYNRGEKILHDCLKNEKILNFNTLAYIYEQLGKCYVDTGDKDRGKFYLLKSLEIIPKEKLINFAKPEIFSRLGFIYMEEGDHKKAKEYLEYAKKYKNKLSYTNWELVEKYLKEIQNRKF